jgi:hypothetical protein
MDRKDMAVILCAAALSGYQLDAKWKDTTGQNRPYATMESDQAGCRQSVGLSESPTYAEFNAALPNLMACMSAHGWVPDDTKAKTPSPQP